LTELRALIAQHPDWHRTARSRHLCELWNWRNRAGRLKEMAARLGGGVGMRPERPGSQSEG
ncbi:MAG: hypothetical protein WCK27_06410, partial [Verrucomicrobiota bacterium]